MGPVVAVVEAEHLLTVRGIHGRVEVERHDPGSPAEAASVTLEDRVGDRVDELVELHRLRRVLETRDRRLGGQTISVHRASAYEHLVDRIVGELVAVVAIGIPQGDGEQPLLNQLAKTVTNLARRPSIPQALGEPLAQPELLVEGLEQQGPAVGAAVRLIEGGHDGLGNQVGKNDSLCGRIDRHEGAPFA